MTEIALQPRPQAPTAFRVSTAWVAPALAALLALIAWASGVRGADLPAQLYRIGLFHRQGLALWDSQWYGGHWTLNYSVLFPPVAGTLGAPLTGIASAAVAALAFDRLVIGYFGRAARLGSAAFAVGTLVQIAIGQLPFLLGEALALCAFWAATRSRWALAIVLAAASAIASPEAGAFLALVIAAWFLASYPRQRVPLGAVAAAGVVPVLVMSALFPGQGRMPFPAPDFAAEGAVFLLAALAIPRTARVFRIGAGLYLLVFVGSFVLSSPLGGNIERFGETVGVPLAICLLWPLRRLVLAVVAVPIAVLQWGPAVTTAAANHVTPASSQSYFDPLISFVDAHDQPAGRVEIVPTALHWEAAYAAPLLPLARGWERQLDTEDNPLFYGRGLLTPATYTAWLIANGVRFVALPSVPLDYSAVAEGRLIEAGIPALRPAWHNADWQVFSVTGSPGLVSGPATLTSLSGGQIALDVTAPGIVTVKERYSSKWAVVDGSGCISAGPGGWLSIDALKAGPLRADIRLVAPPGDAC